jgi:hypothetical protein
VQGLRRRRHAADVALTLHDDSSASPFPWTAYFAPQATRTYSSTDANVHSHRANGERMKKPTEITQSQVDELTAALDQETLLLLYRQWLRADLLKKHFQETYLAETKSESYEYDATFYTCPEGIYLYLWYALLFSVLEGFRERGIDLSFIHELDDELYQSLKDLRHSVFHVPRRDYFDSRMYAPMHQKESVERIFRTHDKVGVILMMQFVARDQQRERAR